MMTLAAFVAAWLGKPCDFDGALGAQCVDLVNQWATQGKGKPRLTGNAYQLMSQAPPAVWLRTANTATNFPPPGAIVVWHADVPAIDVGPFGHCAIALLADGDHLVTLDQNWADKRYAAVVVHTYQGVLGWLTPR